MSEKKKMEEPGIIRYEKGLHVRVAAMIVQRADKLQQKYHVNFLVKREGLHEVPLTSLLLVTSLKVKMNDEIILITQGEEIEQASAEMKQFLESDFSITSTEINQMDTLLQDNIITAESIYSNIESGLVVVDLQNVIIIYNKEAEKLFGKPAAEVLGKHVEEVIPESRLPEVIRTEQPILGYTRTIGKATVVMNSTPIIENGKLRGAISTFEDISKLMENTCEFEEVK